ncbi:MAG: YfcE family phosphodiesterase [Candidatus Bathyarchaeia archaeon]|jgi:putative phosphoesterase
MNASAEPQPKNPSFCKFGAQTVLSLMQTLEAQIGGVVESQDIEYIHKMRVTSRRIRAAMPLFKTCFPKKKFKKWLGEVKKVTSLLGDARDLDVQIEFIKQYIEKLGASSRDRTGMLLLLKNHQVHRGDVQAPVVAGLEELKQASVLPDLTRFCNQIIEELPQTPFDASLVLEKAFWDISTGIDAFLALEEYVHQENEVLAHHKLRIQAKHLRYTMEAFAPLYPTQLSDEIKTMKAIQDTLGEMHDCDVWIEKIPDFIAKTKTVHSTKSRATSKNEASLLNFLDYIKNQRKSHYNNFVQLWDSSRAENFFENLRKTANADLVFDQTKVNGVLVGGAKIAVFADVHANLHALKAVMQDAQARGAVAFLNAGDSVGFGAFPNEALRLLHSHKVASILGNYDLEVVEKRVKGNGAKKTALLFAQKELEPSCVSYLLSFPKELRLELGGKRILVVHGSPDSIEEHLYPKTPAKRLRSLAKKANADLVIVGHSHEQFQTQVNQTLFVNPGSVGRPGDGNSQAAYALLSFDPFKVELIRLDYNVAAAANALRRKGLPESLAQMLIRGVSLDAVLQKDQRQKEALLEHPEKVAQHSKRVAKTYLRNNKHGEQVKNLALSFFDGLSSLHKLGPRERCWLECAALLHDVGLARGATAHNKTSLKLILNDSSLPFSSEDRMIIASIARYHRRGFPKQKHYNLASLSQVNVRKVAVLSSFLRVADGLDYTHESNVKSLSFNVGSKRVTVECLASSNLALEEQAFNKKKDLFEEVFKKKLVLLWKQP